MKVYSFRAIRKSDGVAIHSDVIEDLYGAGMDAMATIVRVALIVSHPLARGLSQEDIDLEMLLDGERSP